MADAALRFEGPVTLVGGGELDAAMLAEARALAPALVAADGGADRLLALGVARSAVRAVIGDMDSIADRDGWRGTPTRMLHLPEQDTTDFEKCLYSTEAPLHVAAGFTGLRTDHTLAVLHALLRYPGKRIVVLGAEDAMALVPPGGIELALEPGARLSVYPLAPVRGVASRGLRWPVDGLEMAAGARIGTSNEATHPRVALRFEGAGALLMLERRFLGALVRAVGAAP